jgi:hypothetical protein
VGGVVSVLIAIFAIVAFMASGNVGMSVFSFLTAFVLGQRGGFSSVFPRTGRRLDHRQDAGLDRFWQAGPSVDYRLQIGVNRWVCCANCCAMRCAVGLQST